MKFIGIVICLFFVLIPINAVFGQDKKIIFRDTTDNAIDLSTWLLELNGFVPLAAPITEPAVGYGAIVAGAIFLAKPKTDGKFRMPDIAGGGAGFTSNGTWFAGGAYTGFWKDDHIRYRGIAGYGSINLKYYGLGNQAPSDFTINSFFFLQQGLFRVKNSNFMVGGKYLLSKTDITGFENESMEFLDPRDFDLINSGIGFIAEFENFNSVLSPSSGLRVHLEYTQFMELLGSDKSNGRATLFTIGYIPINPKWNMGLRMEYNIATENTPFYAKPFLIMRGLPALRYQGDWTLLGETEQFINLYKRWSAVVFGGYGIARQFQNTFQEDQSAWNAGTGIRYLMARVLNLQMGVDIARGPEDWAFYVVFGSAWLK